MLPKFKGRIFLKLGDGRENSISAYSTRRNYKYALPKIPIKKDADHKISSSSGLKRSNSIKIINGAQLKMLQKSANIQNDCPIVDTEISNLVSINTTTQVNKHIAHKVNPNESLLLPKLGTQESLELRISICSDILDFTDLQADVLEKEQKMHALCEISQFLENAYEAKKIDENLLKKMLEMIEANIVRPPPFVQNNYFLIDRTIVFVDPSWPHLFYIYQILNRLISLFPNSPLFDLDFFKKIIVLTDIPDSNERLQVLAFMRLFYDSHLMLQNQILGLVRNKLLSLKMRESSYPPFCVTPLLSFLAHIFQKNGRQPSFEFYTLLRASVFPLISSPYLTTFINYLINLLETAIIPGNSVIMYLHQLLLHMWPVADGEKQSCFAQLLILCLGKMSALQVTNVIKPSIRLIAGVIEGQQVRSLEIVLNFLNGEPPEWVRKHSKRIVNDLYMPIKEISLNHWSPIIKAKASSVITELGKLDKKAFVKACQEKISDRKRKDAESRRKAFKEWRAINKSVDMPEFNRTKIDENIKECFALK